MGSIKHAKTSPVPNPLGDTRRVGGGDWNSEHIIDLDVSDIDGLEARLIPVEQVWLQVPLQSRLMLEIISI